MIRILLSVSLSLLLLVTPALAHDYHVSVSDVRFNPKRQTLEVALRVFTDDLEKALSQRQKQNVKLSQAEPFRQLLASYLQEKLVFEKTPGQPLKGNLIGYEEEDDAVWVYVEVPVQASVINSLRVRNAVFTELFPDQMNMVNLDISGRKTSLILNHEEPAKQVKF